MSPERLGASAVPKLAVTVRAVPAIEDPVKLADDLLHFSLVNNLELAKANADKLLDKKLGGSKALFVLEMVGDDGLPGTQSESGG